MEVWRVSVYICIHTHTSHVVFHANWSLCYFFFLLDSSHFSLVLHIYTLEISRGMEKEKQIKIYLSQIGHPKNYRQGTLLCRSFRVEEKKEIWSQYHSSANRVQFLNSCPGFKAHLEHKEKNVYDHHKAKSCFESKMYWTSPSISLF